jgi:hypothetical protein
VALLLIGRRQNWLARWRARGVAAAPA